MLRTTYKTGTKMIIIVVIILSVLLSSVRTTFATSYSPDTLPKHQAATTYLSLSKFHLRGLDGPYHTQGHLIYGADNQPYLFHGVARDDLEYLCKGDGHYSPQELAYMGLGNSSAQGTYWGANTVRLLLSENFWLYGSPSQHCSPSDYHAFIKKIVDTLNGLQLNVILNLQWTNAGGQSPSAGDGWALPDSDSVTFWKQVAPIYQSYDNVLFEIYNEPHIYTSNNWSCWRNGCQVYNDASGTHDHSTYNYMGVGMQTLLDAIRHTGANNLVLAAGLDWGFDLSQIPTYHLSGSNVVYDTHPYSYGLKQPGYWDAAFGNISAIYPVISAESGVYDCSTQYMQQLMTYFDTHNIGWIGWAWIISYSDPCHYPQIISNYNGSPIAGMGQLEYRHLQSYLTLLASQEVPERKK